MEKLKIGITHGDLNGVGYEIIMKAFADAELCGICTPIIYGSPRAAIYNRKNLNLQTNFKSINSPTEASEGVLNMVVCIEDEVKIELGQPSEEAGKAALISLQRAVADYKAGLIDAIVTAPINKKTIHSKEFPYSGHTEYLEHEFGLQGDALMILMNPMMRVALVTAHLPIKDVAAAITAERIEKRLGQLRRSLKKDFLISNPRVAVLSLNPHCGDGGLLGSEEQDAIIPAIKTMREKGLHCFGPYSADGFFGAGLYTQFDAVLAMYHDQGLAPFKALCVDDAVNFTAGLSVVRTSPGHGTAYDIAGRGEANENPLRQAIYAAIDIVRNRRQVEAASANPLKVVNRERPERPERPERAPHEELPTDETEKTN